MGRKAKFDTKEKRGPGRKTKKQGEPDIGLLIKNDKPKKMKIKKRALVVKPAEVNETPMKKESIVSALKRFVFVIVVEV